MCASTGYTLLYTDCVFHIIEQTTISIYVAMDLGKHCVSFFSVEFLPLKASLSNNKIFFFTLINFTLLYIELIVLNLSAIL